MGSYWLVKCYGIGENEIVYRKPMDDEDRAQFTDEEQTISWCWGKKKDAIEYYDRDLAVAAYKECKAFCLAKVVLLKVTTKYLTLDDLLDALDTWWNSTPQEETNEKLIHNCWSYMAGVHTNASR